MTTVLKFDLRKRLAIMRKNRDRGPKLIAHALNRSAQSARAVIGRGISADMKVAVAAAKDAVRLIDATDTIHMVRFFASAKRIPVYDFRAKGPFPSRGRGRGVTAKTPAGRYPRAFIARMKSGRIGVFERKPGAGRLGIYELFGASIAQVFPKHAPAGIERAREQLQKNLAANLRFLSSGAAA